MHTLLHLEVQEQGLRVTQSGCRGHGGQIDPVPLASSGVIRRGEEMFLVQTISRRRNKNNAIHRFSFSHKCRQLYGVGRLRESL